MSFFVFYHIYDYQFHYQLMVWLTDFYLQINNLLLYTSPYLLFVIAPQYTHLANVQHQQVSN